MMMQICTCTACTDKPNRRAVQGSGSRSMRFAGQSTRRKQHSFKEAFQPGARPYEAVQGPEAEFVDTMTGCSDDVLAALQVNMQTVP